MNSSRNQFLETASRIGARICRDAIWSQGRCNWLGDSMEKLDGSWKVAHRALGPDFYGGTSGIALFLNRLHVITGEPLFRETAQGAILQACSRITHIAPSLRPSFYLGMTGIAYALVSMGLEDKARQTLEPLTEDAAHRGADGASDVIGGIAGAIPPLLAMASALSGDPLLGLAIDYGEELLRGARKSDAGWSWNTMNVPAERRRQDLTGFSHGAAGVAWSLSELFQVTRDERFGQAAEEARRYENSHFDQRFANWPDFRYLYDPDTPSNNGPSYPISWCHGAPGIGLERLRAYQIFGDSALKEQAEIAVRTTEPTVAFKPGTNFSLCHGIGGNAELLLLSSAVFEDSTRLALAEEVAEEGIQQIEGQDLRWPCGVTEGDETPNLMLGTAGIGHFYLRLYDPCYAPSVLIIPAQIEERMLAAC
jgi:lantibiotic biosynthesis protein